MSNSSTPLYDVNSMYPAVAHAGHAMQAHAKVNHSDNVSLLEAAIIRYTGGEYPVSGDASRLRYPLWSSFRHVSVWSLSGVRA